VPGGFIVSDLADVLMEKTYLERLQENGLWVLTNYWWIVVAVVGSILIVLISMYCCWCKKKKKDADDEFGMAGQVHNEVL